MPLNLLRILLLVVLVSPAFGAAGDGTRSFTNLVFGPIVFLVAAIGILACLYQFARGNKAAAFFILGGLIFLGCARAVLRGWLDPAGSAGFTLNLGEFPIYGDNSSLTETSAKNFYGYIASWAYIGLSISHALSMALLSLGIPVLVATLGALITYHKITVRHQPGSIIGYVISVILVGVFCVFPSASFVPPSTSTAPPSDVMRAIAGLDSGIPLPSSTTPDALSIPLLPALVLTAGTDLTQAIGNVINPDPNSMYVAQMLRAARSSAMPDGWETEYQDFAVHCAAAYKGFVSAEAETAEPTVSFIKARLAEARLGRVSASSLNLISNWGDSVFSFVPLHGYISNDSTDDKIYNMVANDPDFRNNSSQAKYLNQDIFWVSPNISSSQKEDSILSLNIYPGFNPGNHMSLPNIKYNNGNNIVVTSPRSLIESAKEYVFNSERIDHLVIPYCSIPRETKDPRLNSPPYAIDLDVDVDTRDVSGYDNLGEMNPGVNGGLFMNFSSEYLHSIAAMVESSRAISIMPFDWSDRIRADLIASFSPAICRTACGNPSHKYYWSCMVSGIFVQLGGESACQSSSEVAQAFYGLIPINSRSSTGISFANMIATGFYPAVKPRSSADTLRGGPGIGNSPSTWDMPTLRTVVDLMMAAPGNFSQHPLARDVFTEQRDTNSLTFWGMISGIPKMGMWVLASVAAMAVEIVSFLWPHFMGLTILIFLVVYPLFGVMALWPGRWHVLLDWARGALWVLLWAPMVSLGFSFINGGAFINSSAAFLSPHDGPGNALLQIVGICLIFSAPAVAQAVISPGIEGLARLGASVYGQGFRATGLGHQLGTLIGGMTGGVMSATALIAGTAGGSTDGASGGTGGSSAVGSLVGSGGLIHGHSHRLDRFSAGGQGPGEAVSSAPGAMSEPRAKQNRAILAKNRQAAQAISVADSAAEDGEVGPAGREVTGFASGALHQASASAAGRTIGTTVAKATDQARVARAHQAANGVYVPATSIGHLHDDSRQFDAAVSAFRGAQAIGDAKTAEAAAHAIVAGHGNVVSGQMRIGALATLGDMRHIGEAMEYLGKQGDATGAEGARRIFREGQRMADGMLQGGRIGDAGERSGVLVMRERLRLGEAQARLSKAEALTRDAGEMQQRVQVATSDGERNFFTKRVAEMNHEAQTERRQAKRQAVEALSGISGSVDDSLAEIGKYVRRDEVKNGLGLRNMVSEASDVLTLAARASRFGDPAIPAQFLMRTAEGQGIADRLEAIASAAPPMQRSILLGMTAAAEGRDAESIRHLDEASKVDSILSSQGEVDSLLHSMRVRDLSQ